MRHLPSAQLLIVDLDNTLWDWMKIWSSSLPPLLETVAQQLGIEQSQLELEAREIHRQVRTSDFELVLDQMPSVVAATSPTEPRVALREAMRKYYSSRKRLTVTYPDVVDTLQEIRAAGTHVAAFTESDEFQATLRIKRTGLDGLIQDLWVAPDLGVTDDETRKTLRTKPPEEYELHRTRVYRLSPGVQKPRPEILKEICGHVGVSPWEAVYVGDSLTRDVAMALDAGVLAVHAAYGVVDNPSQYSALISVSHWSDREIAIDRDLRRQAAIKPNAVLKASIAEIRDHVAFTPIRHKYDPNDPDRLTSLIELWKTSVDVQKSFNTISWQIRGLGITAITAGVAASGFAAREGLEIEVAGYSLSVVSAITTGVLLLWGALWYMESAWYHRLLIGAGIEAQRLEVELRHLLGSPHIGLSHAITARSQEKARKFAVLPYQRKIGVVRARDRLTRFYIAVGSLLASVALIAAWPWLEHQFQNL